MVLLARDIAERDFLWLDPQMSIFDATKKMCESHHGFAIVSSSSSSQSGMPQGIVTEWDIISKVVSQSKDPTKVRLEEIMSRDLVSVKSTDGFDSVAKTMADRGIRRVLVIDDGKMIRIITSKIILRRLEEYIDKVSASIARLQTPLY